MQGVDENHGWGCEGRSLGRDGEMHKLYMEGNMILQRIFMYIKYSGVFKVCPAYILLYM